MRAWASVSPFASSVLKVDLTNPRLKITSFLGLLTGLNLVAGRLFFITGSALAEDRLVLAMIAL